MPPGHWYGVGPLHARRTVAGILAAGVSPSRSSRPRPAPALGHRPRAAPAACTGKVHLADSARIHPGTRRSRRTGRTPRAASRGLAPGQGPRRVAHVRHGTQELADRARSRSPAASTGTAPTRSASPPPGGTPSTVSTTANVLPTYTPRGDPADHAFTRRQPRRPRLASTPARPSATPSTPTTWARPASLLVAARHGAGLRGDRDQGQVRRRLAPDARSRPTLTRLPRRAGPARRVRRRGRRSRRSSPRSARRLRRPGAAVRNAQRRARAPGDPRSLESAVVLDSDAFSRPRRPTAELSVDPAARGAR